LRRVQDVSGPWSRSPKATPPKRPSPRRPASRSTVRRRARGRRWRVPRALRWLAIGVGALALLPPMSDFLLGLRPVVSGCRVVHVVDGDTVDFSCPGEGVIRARITGFDAPELYSPQCAG